MGTINYKTSDFITIGYNCNNIDYEEEFYNDIIQDYFDIIAGNLKNEFFYYFHVTLEPGYYEGFSINIENNFSICYDDYVDKRQAQKEITKIKEFLLQCINEYECCVVYPGWCTGYEDYNNSITKLNAAIEEMRQTVKDTPTYNQYIRKGA
jgi:hypothetical protein